MGLKQGHSHIMTRIKQTIVLVALFFGLCSTSLVAKNFDTVSQAIITKAVKSQPKESYLRKIYEISGYRPIWVTQHSLTPLAKELLQRVTTDPLLEKNTKMYKNARMILAGDTTASIFGGKESIGKHLKLEFKMSKLFRNYTNYTLYGMIHWDHFKVLFKRQAGLNDVYADWEIYPRHTVSSLLRSILTGANLNAEFDALTPKTRLYTNLTKKMSEYRRIALSGQWPTIPVLPKLVRGQSNPSIPLIRKRLSLSGDLKECVVSDSLVYDQCLVDAVKRFQKRHGQEADGVIGTNTAKLLRQNIAEILTKMQLNLDRIKMMKRNDSGRHIMINVPAFKLYFFEDGTIRQSMRTITGSKRHPTPIFSDTVETIVLNPYWNVPTSIIQKEMIPKLLRNKNAMSREGIEVRNGWGPNAKKISPSSINWSQYRYSRSVPFRFAQVPGTRNALGKVKFLFPNKFSVYMHDTPTKHLFKRNVRAYSHGCIRLQKPRELLKTFSSFNQNVDYEKSKKTLKGRKQTYLSLNEKVPVDVAYLTSWVDPSGTLQIRNDIYGYDKMQLKYQRRY